jgi:hypothetical protein
LAAIVAFGPVVFAAAYGVANASRLQAASAPAIAPTIASAPIQPVATQAGPAEERAMIIAPLSHKDIVSASLDRPSGRYQKSPLVAR